VTQPALPYILFPLLDTDNTRFIFSLSRGVLDLGPIAAATPALFIVIFMKPHTQPAFPHDQTPF
jgi:hypothetical protein